MGSLALETRGDRRGPHETVSIAHCLAVQGRIIAHPRFHHSPWAPAFASFCAGRQPWPTKSISVAATRLSQAVRKALDARSSNVSSTPGRRLRSGIAIFALAKKTAAELQKRGRVVACRGRRHQLCRRRARARRNDQGARAYRYPRQQCRHCRAERENLGLSARCLAQRAFDQS